jgi:hypothetical protein
VALHPDPSVSRRRGRSRLHALGRKDGQALLDKARALVQAQRDGENPVDAGRRQREENQGNEGSANRLGGAPAHPQGKGSIYFFSRSAGDGAGHVRRKGLIPFKHNTHGDAQRFHRRAKGDGTHNPRHVDTQREMMQNLAQARLHRHKGRRTKGLLKK